MKIYLLILALVFGQMLTAKDFVRGTGSKKESSRNESRKPEKVNIIRVKLPDQDEDFQLRDFSGRLRRLEEDIEDVDKKIRHAEPGSRRALNLNQEREKLALEFIQEAHRYFLKHGWKKTDSRSRRMRLILNNESAVLKSTLSGNKEFFAADYLPDVHRMLRDIRNGRLKYSGKVPKNDSLLLKDVHKLQSNALEDIHKKQQKNFRRQK